MRDLRKLGPTVLIHRDYNPPMPDMGVFGMKSVIDGGDLRIIATSAEGWDHISVSRRTRCPNWYELEQVKRTFFRDDETAVQFHVPPAEHINNNEHCLHLWRPLDVEMPRPPGILVGLLGKTPADIKALNEGVFS